MADGSVKPISDVAVGDSVTATDPGTGETTSQQVTALHRNVDLDLTDVTVGTVQADNAKPAKGGRDESAGTVRGPPVTLQTTDHHPFWDATDGRWVDAADLEVGHELTGPTGERLAVLAVHSYAGAKVMRDLTVDTIHTYYVLAGDTPVLVHNNNVVCKTDQELQADAEAIHETWRTRYGDQAYNGTTVTTGVLDGELVYTVNRGKTNPDARAVAQALGGYRRVFGADLKGPGQTDAEQIMLNAVDKGRVGSSGRIATSRVPCGTRRQDCGGRIGSGKYPNIRVVGKWGVGSR
jgi:hypothetical protein